MRKPLLTSLLSLGIGLMLAANTAGFDDQFNPGAGLVQKPEQRAINDLVAEILKVNHYASHELDDSLSARIYERYLEVLDPNRSYFLQQDIDGFEKYRNVLDDHIKAQNLEPAFVIYRLFQQRFTERFEFASVLLETEPQFDIDESYDFDRRELDWAKSQRELNEIWRRRVKNDAIGLMLADKPWAETSELLEKRYSNALRRIGQVKSEDVFEIFINAYAHIMDPHTQYFSPRDSEEFQIRMSLSYEGIGAALQNQNEYVTVMRILPGGSADKTGLLSVNDRITGVAQGDDNEMTDVIGWRLDDVVQLIRGPSDSVVRLSIPPAGEAPGTPVKTIRLVRSEIKLEEQAAQKKIVEIERENQKHRIGVIKIPAFYLDFKALQAGEQDYRSTTRDVRRLLKEIEAEDAGGIIIDLRNNGGGSLWEAKELTSLFIDKGPVVQVRYSDGKIQMFEDREPGIEYRGPLMVLVNRFSASASEIFAGAIQDYGRGLIVGSTTYGKGTVQTLVDLKRLSGWRSRDKEPGQLKLTTGKFYRVTGASTQHQGVIPDIELPSAIDPEVVGESVQDTALPWDQIDPAVTIEHDGELNTTSMVAMLQQNHERRVSEDELYSLYLEDVEAAQTNARRKSVSLNLEYRNSEQKRLRETQRTRVNDRRAILGMEPLPAEGEQVENDEDSAPEEEPIDVLLAESAEILVDQVLFGGSGLGLSAKLMAVKSVPK